MVSSHGAVLFYIAVCPDCTIGEIADAMSLTSRSIWGIVGDLRRAGVLKIRREGRRHHYTVNMDAPFRHPILDGIPLRAVLGEIVDRYAGKGPRRQAV
ncbi:MAG: AsnC family transcriptional regulator [Dehalococcoidia bacterium]